MPGWNRNYGLKKRYGIRWPYRSRNVYHHHDDMDLTDQWQREVYLHAQQTMIENHFSTVLDLGCGSGYKLMQNLGDFDTIGLELECNIAPLQQRYPHRKWQSCDLTRPISRTVDLVICADVIEHLVDPDQLIEYLQSIQFQRLIISTPDRSLLYRPWKRRYWGPPRNSTHQREWTFSEFSRYISGTFEILDQQISNREQATQMLTCIRRQLR